MRGAVPPFTLYAIMVWYLINHMKIFISGPGSSVSVATAYGLDGPGIESWWGREFPHQSRPVLRPTQPPVQWVPSLSRG